MATPLPRTGQVKHFLTPVLILAMLASAAAEPPPGPAGLPDGPANAQAGDQPAPAEPPREQTIYIPYTKLREVFEREGRGVFLPYEQFQELWRAAREATRPTVEPGPPVAALITEATHEATIARDVVTVNATVRIDLLKPGWHEIPLRLGDAAITSASIAGQPARLVSRDGGYRLLIEQRGAELQQVELKLEYAKGFTKSPGQNSVSFEAPLAPVSRWRVRVPEAGAKIGIQPLIAATETPARTPDTGPTPVPPEQTVLLAFVGAAPTIRLDWTPRAEGAQGLQALQTVQATQRVIIDEGVVRTRAVLAYDITRAAVDRLTVAVSADQKVVNVFDPNVRQWSVATEGEVQIIAIELFQPARGLQSIAVELERFDERAARPELQIPVVQARDVLRQQGLLAIAAGEGLRVEPLRRGGLSQVDAAELLAWPNETPANAGQQPPGGWALSYRYAAAPFDLVLRVKQIEPSITAAALVTARLAEKSLEMRMELVYVIEKAGVFRLELEIPPGCEVRRPHGSSVAGATAVAVESHHVVDDPAGRRLVVNLSRKALGRVGLELNFHARLNEPDLLAPTAGIASVPIRVPRIVGLGVERFSGRLVADVAESLRANPGELAGLRPITVAEARNWDTAPPAQNAAPQPAAGLAYAFGAEPAALTLKVERRKPHVTMQQLLLVRLESGVVKYEAAFLGKILYSAVPELRIDVPSELVGRVQNHTVGIREAVIESPQPPPAEGYTALGFRGETDLKGDLSIKLSWETRTAALDIGKSIEVLAPRLQPVGVDRAWGQIALLKAETIDLRATGGPAGERPIGLRPIDPLHDLQDVPDTVATEGVARAFEFHDVWTLGITATRYKLEDVKRTSIERGLVRMAVTRSGQIAAQALYRLRSAQQRLAVVLPAGVAFDTDPVRIDDRPVRLERGPQDELYIPLVGYNPDQALVLEIRYTLPDGGTRLVCPHFPEQPAVQKVYLLAYLPPEWTLLGARGPWTEQIRWRWRELRGFEPLPGDGSDLLGWIRESQGKPADPPDTFQVDGRPYLFWALQPVAPPAGRLRLITIHEHVLAALVFLIIAGVGVYLLRTRAATRLVASGAFAVLLILLGVFLPTFLRQIVNGTLFAALALVAVLWIVWYAAVSRPRANRARPPGDPPPRPANTTGVPAPTPTTGGPSHA